MRDLHAVRRASLCGALAVATTTTALVVSMSARAQDLDNTEFYLGENGAIPFTIMANGAPRSCNEVSFAAIPGDSAHVIGRYNNTCTGSTFSLARYAIDWNARTLTLANIAFNTGGGNVPISKNDSVSTAYDATVMSYGGELWVAFECGGNLAGCQTASACVGPMNASTGVIDPARTNVIVLGNNSLGDGYLYSGSVPELLNFNGTPYVYWSAVKINAANTSSWANITGRGMKLKEVAGQLWNANTGTWVGSADPNNTVQVWGLDAGSSVTDLQGVFTNGTDIFMTAGVAGAGCGMPFWPPTCYSFTVSKSSSPLATDAFKNGTRLSAGELPTNTHSYSRFIQDPDGRGYILGGYYTNAPGVRPVPVSGGPNAAYVAAFPIPQASSYFDPLGGGMAFPTSGTTIPNQDGRLETFVVGTDHNVFHAWQNAAGGSYSGFAPLPPAAMTSPIAQRNADGRLELFAIGPGRAIWHIWQATPGGAWAGGWASLGGIATGGPAAERNVDGTLEVFVVGAGGAVFHNQQTSGAWSGWTSLGGSAIGSPVVQRNADGRLEVFVVGTDGRSITRHKARRVADGRRSHRSVRPAGRSRARSWSGTPMDGSRLSSWERTTLSSIPRRRHRTGAGAVRGRRSADRSRARRSVAMRTGASRCSASLLTGASNMRGKARPAGHSARGRPSGATSMARPSQRMPMARSSSPPSSSAARYSATSKAAETGAAGRPSAAPRSPTASRPSTTTRRSR